jgi:transcriptional regulator with XRE-family HTH domain
MSNQSLLEEWKEIWDRVLSWHTDPVKSEWLKNQKKGIPHPSGRDAVPASIEGEEKTVGQILKEARQNKGLTTGKVLYETGVSEEYLRKLEADELKTPSAGVLWKLAQLYSIDLKPLAIKAGIIIKKPPSTAPIEQEKKADRDEDEYFFCQSDYDGGEKCEELCLKCSRPTPSPTTEDSL